MKLFTKIFLLGILIFGLAFSASGYFLLHYSLESSLARESEFALKQYQYDKFTVQSALLTSATYTISMINNDELLPGDYQSFTIWESSSDDLERDYRESDLFRLLAEELSVSAAFFAEDHSLLYSNIQGLDSSFLDELTENAHAWQFFQSGNGGSILVGSILRYDDLPAAGTAAYLFCHTMGYQQDPFTAGDSAAVLSAMLSGCNGGRYDTFDIFVRISHRSVKQNVQGCPQDGRGGLQRTAFPEKQRRNRYSGGEL